MKRILIDSARASVRRSAPREELVAAVYRQHPPIDIEQSYAVEEALASLRREHPREAFAIEMMYLRGLSRDEIAAELGISATQARRTVRLGLNRMRKILVAPERGTDDESEGGTK